MTQTGPVLGIETSCDETGIALFDGDRVDGDSGLLAHALYSQIDMHAEYGGVVPELASRDHMRKLPLMIEQMLKECGQTADHISALAYTAGPGLVGALMVGGAVAAGLSAAWDVPLIPVHHMEGHLLAVMLEDDAPVFPFVALLVSGGHTLLVDVQAPGRYKILGQTLDDAVGEAFDKTAKLLGLGYPGGPALAKLAQTGNPETIRLPRPMVNRPGLDFSFSGLKTAVYTTLMELGNDEACHADLARAFEEAVVETLQIKCRRSMEQTGAGALVVAGGVGANQRLRAGLQELADKHGFTVHYPRPEYCTDNGAMIAHAGWLRRHQPQTSRSVIAKARWSLEDLEAI